MAFKIGTVECKLTNIMGMPTDTGTCTHKGCNATQTYWGQNTFTRLEKWAKEHSATHATPDKSGVKPKE